MLLPVILGVPDSLDTERAVHLAWEQGVQVAVAVQLRLLHCQAGLVLHIICLVLTLL